MPQQRIPAVDRFWKHVQLPDDPNDPTACWLWTGACAPWPNHPEIRGYGRFTIYLPNGKARAIQVHRFSWTLHYGPIPAGLGVCHHCDIPACVRPGHLFLGTQKDNGLDAAQKERLPWGEAHYHRKLTEGDVREIRAYLPQRTETYTEIGRRYGVTQMTILDIVWGKTWKHLP